MNKDVLVKIESIKRTIKALECNGRSYMNISTESLLSIIEQADRVQELEEECAGWKEASRFNDEELYQQNKRYREAIKFGIEYLKNSDIRQVQLVVTALKSVLEVEE